MKTTNKLKLLLVILLLIGIITATITYYFGRALFGAKNILEILGYISSIISVISFIMSVIIGLLLVINWIDPIL